MNDIVKQTEESVVASEQLVQRAADAKKALDLIHAQLRPEWVSLSGEMNKFLIEFRQLRMAMDAEVVKAFNEAKEVRKFFLSEDHEKEIERLRDFIVLCERLKALKDAGFLDRVADVMLKLEKV